jgi:GNAT superfamily N-acetyltransferase
VDPTEQRALVLLGHADLDEALLLSDEARWNQTAADWAIFMDHGECHGIRVDGRLVASAAILPYGGGFGWISMVLVTAEWRRRGLASELMDRCIKAMRARGDASLLDATPEGALVYSRLGFRSRCGMARWRGMGRGRTSANVRNTHTTDALDAMLAGDGQAFGGDRGFLLKNFLGREGSTLIGDTHDFVIVRQGRRAAQIGPLVTRNQATARELLEAALDQVSGRAILDVLDAGACLRPLLEERGFEAFRSFERMVLDRDDLPGTPPALMVAAGPEFG